MAQWYRICLPRGGWDLIPGLGRSPGEGNGNPLHYSCLRNPMDKGAWWAAVHGVARVGYNLATKPLTYLRDNIFCSLPCSLCEVYKLISAQASGYVLFTYACLEWLAFHAHENLTGPPFALSACVHAKSLQSCLTLWDLWTVACQTLLSMDSPGKKYWSGTPCPPPG